MANQSTPSGDERLERIGSTLSKAEQFLEKNKNIITYVVGGIAVLVLAIWGYKNFIQGPKITKAENDIYMAQMYYEMDSLDLALNGDGTYPGFLEILENYSTTPSADLAHYYVGMIYLKKGQFQEAIDELEEFDGDDDIIRPMAIGCIGDAHLELGDQEEALAHYMEAADFSDNSFTTPMYLMRAAWVNEDLGQWEEALVLYERIRDNYKKTFEGSEINKYIARATAMKEAGK